MNLPVTTVAENGLGSTPLLWQRGRISYGRGSECLGDQQLYYYMDVPA